MIRRGISIIIYEKFYLYLTNKITLPITAEIFKTSEDIQGVSFLLSVGGDGTLLETAAIIRDSRIPVLGINTGRLGFLSPVSNDAIDAAIEALVNQDYTIDKRSLIEVRSSQQEFGEFPFALNDVTITNKQRNSMITIHAYVNDQFKISNKITLQGGLRYNQISLNSDFSNNLNYYPFQGRPL